MERVQSKWWSVDHHEELTCHCHRVEDVEVVLPVMVASKTEARGGRIRRQKGWSAAVFPCSASRCCCALLLLCHRRRKEG